jgi:hypothetical protein
VWNDLAAAANSILAAEISSGEIAQARRYAPTTSEEIQSIFFARLDMISSGNKTISEVFKVPSHSAPLGSEQLLISVEECTKLVSQRASLLRFEWESKNEHCISLFRPI